jgi:hypothetical protein
MKRSMQDDWSALGEGAATKRQLPTIENDEVILYAREQPPMPVSRRCDIAHPLLWSHANYLILSKVLGT